jgi:hypothetical protein
MESSHITESRASDELLDSSLSENDEHDAVLSDEALRLVRIAEFQHESLHAEDHLEANFAVITGGVFRLVAHSEKITLKLLDDGATETSPELQRAKDTYSSLSRQAERNVKVLIRLREDRRHGAETKARRHQAAVPGSFADSRRRNKK